VSNGANSKPVLEVRDLRTYFYTRRGVGRAVDGVSFTVAASETLGIVGESGSGKSMTALSILGLHPARASRIVGGEVLLNGVDLVKQNARGLRSIRGAQVGLVLQDPMAALNPIVTVGDQLFESLRLHRGLRGQGLTDRATELFKLLRIPGARSRLASYPHQMSGGMKQRAVSAIALAGEPLVLVADEPTTALDVTVEAAYLQLLKDIQAQMRLAIVLITHDFSIVERICDRVMVMYAGKVVETGTVAECLNEPRHPYSIALRGSIPRVDEPPARLVSIEGQPPSIFNVPDGCSFHTRCWLYERLNRPARCREVVPAPNEFSDGDHMAACHFASEAGSEAGQPTSNAAQAGVPR
jgi:oligopeptide/dipeptide ABC transporter ATP-binding protein